MPHLPQARCGQGGFAGRTRVACGALGWSDPARAGAEAEQPGWEKDRSRHQHLAQDRCARRQDRGGARTVVPGTGWRLAMDIILLWTIWATAFSSPPELMALESMCRRTHPEGRITISRELLSWNERNYPAAMIICARQVEANTDEPDSPQSRHSGAKQSI